MPNSPRPALLAAWSDLPFLSYRAANLLLRTALVLFRAGLLPRSTLPRVLAWAERIKAPGEAEVRRRRFFGAVRRRPQS
jgi:hypothetical protein